MFENIEKTNEGIGIKEVSYDQIIWSKVETVCFRSSIRLTRHAAGNAGKSRQHGNLYRLFRPRYGRRDEAAFRGLYVVGFSAVLAGGCPFRQLILTGQGSCDSAVTFLGMLFGAAISHNFGLAGAAAKAATETEPAVAGGPGIYGKVAVILCIIVLFIIACTQKRKTAK